MVARSEVESLAMQLQSEEKSLLIHRLSSSLEGAEVKREELERAIATLPPNDLKEFSAWFEEFLADAWDRQLEADILAGRLDGASRRAAEDYKAGRCTPR